MITERRSATEMYSAPKRCTQTTESMGRKKTPRLVPLHASVSQLSPRRDGSYPCLRAYLHIHCPSHPPSTHPLLGGRLFTEGSKNIPSAIIVLFVATGAVRRAIGSVRHCPCRLHSQNYLLRSHSLCGDCIERTRA